MTAPSRDTTLFYTLVLFIVVVFLTGGSAREEVLSLLMLRPLSIIALALGVAVTTRATWDANRGLILAALAVPAIIALHLVPLSPALWHALPGRELAVEIDAATGLADRWRPLSLVPYRTINALFATATPLAGLLLALALPRERLVASAYLVLGLAASSAALGLFQILGGTGNPFYLYRVTNDGSAVGLFANRNHSAIFIALIIPFLAAAVRLLPASSEQRRPREWLAGGAAALSIPFLLATQSRAGIVVGLACFAAAAWVYGRSMDNLQSRRTKEAFDPRLLFASLAVAAMATLTVLTMKTNAIQRLASLGRYDDELRLRVWGPIVKMTGDFMPFGSGVGTFVEAFAAGETDALLKPTYLNHAHNDWLEVLMTGGLPWLAVIIVAGTIVVRRGFVMLRREKRSRLAPLRRLGLIVMIIMALGSLYDYPLRVPSLALLLALGAVWFAGREAALPAVRAADGDIGSATPA